jgi:hypothetical protein
MSCSISRTVCAARVRCFASAPPARTRCLSMAAPWPMPFGVSSTKGEASSGARWLGSCETQRSDFARRSTLSFRFRCIGGAAGPAATIKRRCWQSPSVGPWRFPFWSGGCAVCVTRPARSIFATMSDGATPRVPSFRVACEGHPRCSWSMTYGPPGRHSIPHPALCVLAACATFRPSFWRLAFSMERRKVVACVSSSSRARAWWHARSPSRFRTPSSTCGWVSIPGGRPV